MHVTLDAAFALSPRPSGTHTAACASTGTCARAWSSIHTYAPHVLVSRPVSRGCTTAVGVQVHRTEAMTRRGLCVANPRVGPSPGARVLTTPPRPARQTPTDTPSQPRSLRRRWPPREGERNRRRGRGDDDDDADPAPG
eukprot:scaffold3449_cov339-Prasinococcus_capsulatus_cf.AAC.6